MISFANCINLLTNAYKFTAAEFKIQIYGASTPNKYNDTAFMIKYLWSYGKQKRVPNDNNVFVGDTVILLWPLIVKWLISNSEMS